MQFLQRCKRYFLVVMLACVAALGAELLLLHHLGGTYHTRGWLSLAILIPPLGATLCFFPLCHLAWFGPGAGRSFRRSRLVFFWIIAGGMALVWFDTLWRLLWYWNK